VYFCICFFKSILSFYIIPEQSLKTIYLLDLSIYYFVHIFHLFNCKFVFLVLLYYVCLNVLYMECISPTHGGNKESIYLVIECFASKLNFCWFMLLPYFETVNLIEFAYLCCVFTSFSLKTIYFKKLSFLLQFLILFRIFNIYCKVHKQLYGDE